MDNFEISNLINEISKLPGLGRKSAQRIALYILQNKEKIMLPLVNSLDQASSKIVNCDECGNIDISSPCSLCNNSKRDIKTICVVEDVSDLWTFERMGFYKGLYHVLGGHLSAIKGIDTNNLTIKSLIERINKNQVKEVILALSTTFDGQTTSHVVADKLEAIENLEVTRLAQGVPIGGEVHYLDENTLTTAFESRKKII